MKRKNMPARKLLRQLNAGRDMSKPYSEDELQQLDAARAIRTKKSRVGLGRLAG